jgi:hypothetical protein
MARVITAESVAAELEMRKREYGLALESMAERVRDAYSKLAAGKVSNHDGFNLGSQASELQALATKIEFYMRKVVILRLPADLHRAVKDAARRQRISLNAYVQEVLRRKGMK